MKQNALVVVVALCAAGLLWAATPDDFALKVVPASSVLKGAVNSTATTSIDYTVTLDSAIDAVQGWSFGLILQPEAGTTMSLTALQVATDTITAGPNNDDPSIPGGRPSFQDTAFYRSDYTTPVGKALPNGTCKLEEKVGDPPVVTPVTDAVAITQGIVLDNAQVIVLPITAGFELVNFTVAVTATIGETPAKLGEVVFSDAVGAPPVATVIVHGGASFSPTVKASAEILSEVSVKVPKADFTIAVGNAPVAPIEGDEWQTAKLPVYLSFDADPDAVTGGGGNIQGWSYSVCVDDTTKAKVVSATINGTETATVNGGEKAGFVTITVEDDGAGVSQAIVIDLNQVNSLVPKNNYLDLIMTVSAGLPEPADEADPPKAFFYACNEVFGEPPVAAVMVIGGASFPSSRYFGTNPDDPDVGCEDPAICNQPGYVYSTPAGFSFLPGNANGDNKLDLADGIFILSYLFRQGRAPGCVAALDANGDGALDASDAIMIFHWQFLNGPAPFLGVECGKFETTLPCEVQEQCN